MCVCVSASCTSLTHSITPNVRVQQHQIQNLVKMATSTSSASSTSTSSVVPIAKQISTSSSDVLHNYHLRYHYYSSALSRSLLTLLSEAHCTDVQLSTGHQAESIRAHRLILSATSPYFKSLFNSLPFSQSFPVIIIREIGYDTLCAIIEFCYRGKCQCQ